MNRSGEPSECWGEPTGAAFVMPPGGQLRNPAPLSAYSAGRHGLQRVEAPDALAIRGWIVRGALQAPAGATALLLNDGLRQNCHRHRVLRYDHVHLLLKGHEHPPVRRARIERPPAWPRWRSDPAPPW